MFMWQEVGSSGWMYIVLWLRCALGTSMTDMEIYEQGNHQHNWMWGPEALYSDVSRKINL
jgi:hypothetical protein